MTDRIDALKDLLTRLIDSRDGYRDAIDHVSNPALKATMGEFLSRREKNADTLRAHLVRAGAEVDDDGSLLASAHRSWLNLKDTVTGSDDASVLAEVVRGEKALLDQYDTALEAAGGTDPEYAFLRDQHASLKQAIAQLENRKDLAA